jgi:hypothetical protein
VVRQGTIIAAAFIKRLLDRKPDARVMVVQHRRDWSHQLLLASARDTATSATEGESTGATGQSVGRRP